MNNHPKPATMTLTGLMGTLGWLACEEEIIQREVRT